MDFANLIRWGAGVKIFWIIFAGSLKDTGYRYMIIFSEELRMIKSFKTKIAEDIFDGIESRNSRKLHSDLQAKAVRLLDQINAITDVETLRVPPSNHLEKLVGNYKDYWSIRINKQWRVIFRWVDGNAHDVDILDCHP